MIILVQNYYISLIPATFFAGKVFNSLDTLHYTLYTSSYAAHQTTFHTKKENLHLPKVLMTISSERSKKVLLAQMVYDGFSHHQQR